jgi:hypothetical protein
MRAVASITSITSIIGRGFHHPRSLSPDLTHPTADHPLPLGKIVAFRLVFYDVEE